MRKGRKGTMMVALVAQLVAIIFVTAAYAATINCTGGSCFGTPDSDTLNESAGDDQMHGGKGGDKLDANNAAPGDRDKTYGGRGNDDLFADDGDNEDLLVGGRGRNDECFADEGDEVQSCDHNVTRF